MCFLGLVTLGFQITAAVSWSRGQVCLRSTGITTYTWPVSFSIITDPIPELVYKLWDCRDYFSSPGGCAVIEFLGKSPWIAGIIRLLSVSCFCFFFNICLHTGPSLHTDVGCCVGVPLNDSLVLGNMRLFESVPDGYTWRGVLYGRLSVAMRQARGQSRDELRGCWKEREHFLKDGDLSACCFV